MYPMILSDNIQDNRLWDDQWENYTEFQKLDSLKDTVLEIVTHIRAMDCITYDDIRKDVDDYIKTKLEKLKICSS